jgi:hypothetical protein
MIRALSRRGVSGLARCGLLLLFVGGPAGADYPDWANVADEEVIEVITRDEDGDVRESKVWFVLVDGEPYLRTNGSRWLENLRREGDCSLRIRDVDYEARAVEVPGGEWIEAVDAASREKYGWQERMIHPFRMRPPEIIRLSPRGPLD